MALNELQLSALDLLIKMKEFGPAPAGFIHVDADVNNIQDVAVAAAAVGVVAAAVAAVPAPGIGSVAGAGASGSPSGRGISLDQLKKIREESIISLRSAKN